MNFSHDTPSPAFIRIINQIFEIEKKANKLQETNSIGRNFRRIKQELEEMGIRYHNPTGEAYDETRTDCEASISGTSTQSLVITEVIKPIIRLEKDGFTQIIQRGIVVVEGK